MKNENQLYHKITMQTMSKKWGTLEANHPIANEILSGK
jgi:hypothetical protein